MLSNHFTEKLIGLKGVIVKNVIQHEEKTEIQIEMERKPHTCPCCGTMTDYVHDYRSQAIHEIPAFGKQVILVLRKRRYSCPKCGKKFFEINTFLPRYHRMTNRLAAYVISKLTDVRSFTSVAKEVNLSVSTVIRIFDNVSYGVSELPKVIAIDEFKGNTNGEKYQCIITDPVNRRVLDIIPCRYKFHLIEYFKPFDRTHTTHFVSDMWGTYADISRDLFKNSVFVVDKYHYMRQVIWAFDSVRKEEQQRFSASRRKYFKHSKSLLLERYEYLNESQKQEVNLLLYTSERLLKAYSLKEEFFKVRDCTSSAEAKVKLSNWILIAQDSGIKRFVDCGDTMVHWSVGILNSFDCSYTNGFTEGANNKIKVLKRNAYGYRNFNRFRNRILHIFNCKESSVA